MSDPTPDGSHEDAAATITSLLLLSDERDATGAPSTSPSAQWIAGSERGATRADIEQIAQSVHLSGPAKLQVLADLIQQGFSDDDLMPLALALVKTGDSPVRWAEELIATVKESYVPGDDPLGRDPLTYFLGRQARTTPVLR